MKAVLEALEPLSDGCFSIKVGSSAIPEVQTWAGELKKRENQREKMTSDPKVKDYHQKRVEIIIQDRETRRTTDISDHFHAHCTEAAQLLNMSRDQVYAEVLLLAVEMEPPPGGAPYPYIITSQRIRVLLPSGSVMMYPADVLVPLRTGNRTNKEMMTAVEAAHRYAAVREIVLTEKPEFLFYRGGK
jgi:hypothetical protein